MNTMYSETLYHESQDVPGENVDRNPVTYLIFRNLPKKEQRSKNKVTSKPQKKHFLCCKYNQDARPNVQIFREKKISVRG